VDELFEPKFGDLMLDDEQYEIPVSDTRLTCKNGL